MTKTIEEIGADMSRAVNDLIRGYNEVSATMRKTTFIISNYSNALSDWYLLIDSYLGRRGIYRKDGQRIK